MSDEITFNYIELPYEILYADIPFEEKVKRLHEHNPDASEEVLAEMIRPIEARRSDKKSESKDDNIMRMEDPVGDPTRPKGISYTFPAILLTDKVFTFSPICDLIRTFNPELTDDEIMSISMDLDMMRNKTEK